MAPTMRFEITIDEQRKYVLELDKMLGIEEALLDRQLSEQPSQYAWVATLCALATAKRKRMEMDLEVDEAKFAQEVRSRAAAAGDKVTEKSISEAVILNKGLIKVRRDLIDATEQEHVCGAAEQAFRHRKDCLIASAANFRAQADSTITLGGRARGNP